MTQSTVYSLLFLTLNELINVSPIGNPEIDIDSPIRVLCETVEQNKEPRTVEVAVQALETLGKAPFQQLLHERCSKDTFKGILESLLNLTSRLIKGLKKDLHVDGNNELSPQDMARRVVSKSEAIKSVAMQISASLHCLKVWLTDQSSVAATILCTDPEFAKHFFNTVREVQSPLRSSLNFQRSRKSSTDIAHVSKDVTGPIEEIDSAASSTILHVMNHLFHFPVPNSGAPLALRPEVSEFTKPYNEDVEHLVRFIVNRKLLVTILPSKNGECARIVLRDSTGTYSWEMKFEIGLDEKHLLSLPAEDEGSETGANEIDELGDIPARPKGMSVGTGVGAWNETNNDLHTREKSVTVPCAVTPPLPPSTAGAKDGEGTMAPESTQPSESPLESLLDRLQPFSKRQIIPDETLIGLTYEDYEESGGSNDTAGTKKKDTNGRFISIPRQHTMEQILSDPQAYEALLEFMRAEHSEESIEFWMDVIFFREECPENELVATALELFATYIDEDSIKQVNLPSHIFKKLKDAKTDLLERRTGDVAVLVARDLFDEAQDQLKMMIERDPLRRFRQTGPAVESLLVEEGVQKVDKLVNGILTEEDKLGQSICQRRVSELDKMNDMRTNAHGISPASTPASTAFDMDTEDMRVSQRVCASVALVFSI
jgi:hypothetical protein